MLHRSYAALHKQEEYSSCLPLVTSFPPSTLPVQQGTSALPAGETIDLGETNGKWKVLFYWPKDFTFVCPTEIVGYGELKQDSRIATRC